MPELNGEEADHDKSETEDGEARQDTETDDGSTIPEVAMPQEKPAELNRKEHEHEKSETENGNEENIMEMRKGENQIFVGSAIGGNSNLRPSLPRSSKTNHRIVPSKDTENPGHPGKRSNRKSFQ